MFRSIALAAATCVLISSATIPARAAGESTGPGLVVYPLAGAQKSAADTGAAISAVISTRLRELGGVVVLSAPDGTPQTDFLAAARKAGAAYYVSGYVTPIGAGQSVVEQLVSARSGTVLWSNTSRLNVAADARDDAFAIQQNVIKASRPGYAAVSSAPAAPAASTAPAKPAAAPVAPAAVAAAPAVAAPVSAAPATGDRTAAIFAFGGDAPDEARDYVRASLERTMPKYHLTGFRTNAAFDTTAALMPALCAQLNATELISGKIGISMNDIQAGAWPAATVTLNTFDCTKPNGARRTITETAQAIAPVTAIDIAVDMVLKDVAKK